MFREGDKCGGPCLVCQAPYYKSCNNGEGFEPLTESALFEMLRTGVHPLGKWTLTRSQWAEVLRFLGTPKNGNVEAWKALFTPGQSFIPMRADVGLPYKWLVEIVSYPYKDFHAFQTDLGNFVYAVRRDFIKDGEASSRWEFYSNPGD